MTDITPQQFASNLAECVRAEGGLGIYNDNGNVDAIRFPNGKVTPWRAPEDLPVGGKEGDLAARLIRTASSITMREAAILRDERLSDAAKNEDIAKLAAEGAETFRRVCADVDANEIDFTYAKANTFAVPRLTKDDAVGALEDRELRDFVRALSPGDQANLAQKMLMGQDDATLIALKRSPTPLPGGAIAQSIGHAWRAYIHRTKPDAARGIERREEFQAWLKIIRESAHAALPQPAPRRRNPEKTQ